MTTIPPQSTEHLIQICRERSSRGVATRADWQRLAEIDPDRAHRELANYLELNEQQAAPNPYDSSRRPRTGLASGFVVGVVFMIAWWLFGEFLHENVVTSARQWDVVTLTQYVAASMLPLFAWIGYRVDQKRSAHKPEPESPTERLKNASWEELLVRFDETRKAGGTRMY